MSRMARTLLIVLLQTAVLVAMVAARQWTLNTGTPVVLETAPIDPRSLFSGDYVRLGYTISTLNLNDIGGDRDLRPHETVYVVLAPGEPYWKAVAVYRERPALPGGQVAIKGRVQYVSDWLWVQQRNVPVKNAQVRYGIEEYFVPEGEGRELERPKPGEKISIQVAVDHYGNAGIKAVLVNGQPRYVERLF